MASAKYFLVLAILGAASSSCASGPNAPGMAVVASSGASSGPGSMLVAFPKTACTGTDTAVFMDDKGAFIGSVAPGTATYVAFPPEATRIFVVAGTDITANRGAWFRRHEIAAPGERVDHGIVVGVPRRDAKNCYGSAQPHPEVVTYEAATRAALKLTWLDVSSDEGEKWLTEHRARVNELLGRVPPDPAASAPKVTTLTHIP